ncbi:hypothetical protein AGMMS50256_06190 [Betaproteobacteria bacterium]|nr:hypothetical protein AGMMS50256_06190 [Betaproteobacteria bacterium]
MKIIIKIERASASRNLKLNPKELMKIKTVTAPARPAGRSNKPKATTAIKGSMERIAKRGTGAPGVITPLTERIAPTRQSNQATRLGK